MPAGVWPSVYDGTYLFADFNCGAIARLTPGTPPTASDFATGLGSSTLVEPLFGPSPAGTSLYYTTYAAGGQVRRIDFAAPPPAASFTTLPPCRVIDTRGATGPTGGPALQANGTRSFPIAGACGVPMAAVAVTANVTVTGSSVAGALRIGPARTTPTLDTLSFRAGVTRANNAVLGLFGMPAGSAAVVSGFSSGTVDLIVDVTGYWQ